MSNNNTPTAPGWWYRNSGDETIVVRTKEFHGDLIFPSDHVMGFEFVQDDGLWAGPVPMPGEWVSLGEHEAIIERLWVAELIRD